MSSPRLPALRRRRQLLDVALEVFAAHGFHGTSMAEVAMAEAAAALIEADIDAEHRRLLAYGIVGLAEATSRYWVVGGRREDPAAVSSRVADLAWAGLRGV